MTDAGREPDVAGFALHGDDPSDPVHGRLAERGLHDELKPPPPISYDDDAQPAVQLADPPKPVEV
jgi:hypothetical protein